MGQGKKITCHVCGAPNDPGKERCSACGAALDLSMVDMSGALEVGADGLRQDGFDWRWALLSLGVFAILELLAFGILPAVVSAYDPQGFRGMMIASALWFVGAFAISARSPGATLLEPAAGAVVVAIPTMLHVASISDVYQLSAVAYVVGGTLGVLVALFGAIIGEKFQIASR